MTKTLYINKKIVKNAKACFHERVRKTPPRPLKVIVTSHQSTWKVIWRESGCHGRKRCAHPSHTRNGHVWSRTRFFCTNLPTVFHLLEWIIYCLLTAPLLALFFKLSGKVNDVSNLQPRLDFKAFLNEMFSSYFLMMCATKNKIYLLYQVFKMPFVFIPKCLEFRT